jgi:hypothetical protein
MGVKISGGGYKAPKLKSYRTSVDLSIDLDIKIKMPSDGASIITDKIDEATNLALNIISSEIGGYLNDAISSSIWGGSDPDIVDSGKLRNSLTVTRSGSSIIISYDEPYAKLIHYGGYIVPYGNESAARKYIEGKPWVESIIFGNGPIAGYDYQEAYNRAIAAIR